MIATASSQSKLDFVRKEGGLSATADHTLIYNDTPASESKKGAKLLEWQAQILKITKGKGVDVVFDPVGLLNVRPTALALAAFRSSWAANVQWRCLTNLLT